MAGGAVTEGAVAAWGGDDGGVNGAGELELGDVADPDVADPDVEDPDVEDPDVEPVAGVAPEAAEVAVRA